MEKYREVQRYDLWVDLLVLGMGLIMPIAILISSREIKEAFVAVFVALLMGLIWTAMGPMTTVIDGEALRVRFGLLTLYRRSFPFETIESAEVVIYNPIREYGGWGIRGIPVTCLNARGNRGVKLQLKDGKSMLIGSQNPEELYARLKPLIG